MSPALYASSHLVRITEADAYTCRYLAFIGVSKEAKFEEEKALIDYNVEIFQDALNKVFTRP